MALWTVVVPLVFESDSVGGCSYASVAEVRRRGCSRHFRGFSPYDACLEREPQLPTRTSMTTILYPATGPTSGAPAQGARRSIGALPPHRFRSRPRWNATGLHERPFRLGVPGFVVAAPLFPLSNGNVPGGPDAGDVVNQPEDMSFVISSVLADSHSSSGPLAGLVNPNEVGAAGHSNGACTTLGLVANTCCSTRR